jgi:hypothetical protein
VITIRNCRTAGLEIINAMPGLFADRADEMNFGDGASFHLLLLLSTTLLAMMTDVKRTSPNAHASNASTFSLRFV